MSVIEANQPSGDMSDPAVPCLTVFWDVLGSSIDADFGAGRFRVRSRPGSLYLSMPDYASRVLAETPHLVRSVSIPRALVAATLSSAGPDSPYFDSLHFGPFDCSLTRSLIESIWRAGGETDRASQLYVDSAATALLLNLLRLARIGVKRGHGGLAPYQLKRVTEYIADRLTDELSLGELADLVGLSAHHFCRVFKQSTGLPPHRWQVQQRVEKAKALMLDTDLNLADIAIAAGFSDQSHFTTVFRKAAGATPNAWRRVTRS